MALSKILLDSIDLTGSGNTTTSNIIVTGNTTTSNLTVTGNTTTGNIIVTGNTTTGNLIVTGNVTGNLTVTGNTTTGNLTVTGSATLAGNSIATHTGTETLTNKTLTSPTITNELATTIRETITISATAATGTINFDASTQVILYYTTNASGNFTLNFRGTSGISMNTLMSTGQSLSATFLVTNGTTAYYNSAATIDGNSVIPKWQNGTAPTAGNASSVDGYTYVIIKTGNAAFTVLASITKFA